MTELKAHKVATDRFLEPTEKRPALEGLSLSVSCSGCHYLGQTRLAPRNSSKEESPCVKLETNVKAVSSDIRHQRQYLTSFEKPTLFSELKLASTARDSANSSPDAYPEAPLRLHIYLPQYHWIREHDKETP